VCRVCVPLHVRIRSSRKPSTAGMPCDHGRIRKPQWHRVFPHRKRHSSLTPIFRLIRAGYRATQCLPVMLSRREFPCFDALAAECHTQGVVHVQDRDGDPAHGGRPTIEGPSRRQGGPLGPAGMQPGGPLPGMRGQPGQMWPCACMTSHTGERPRAPDGEAPVWPGQERLACAGDRLRRAYPRVRRRWQQAVCARVPGALAPSMGPFLHAGETPLRVA
jgi:hypothetical protein